MNIRNKISLKVLGVALVFGAAFLIANPEKTGISWLDKPLEKLKINLGLDLQGGVHLVYEADMSSIKPGEEKDALSGIQDVIERRVNAYGVAEPVVQTAQTGGSYRLIVELAGVKDIEDAKKMIKETPFLEFKEQKEKNSDQELTPEQQQLVDKQLVEIEKENSAKEAKASELLEKAKNGENFEELAKNNSEDEGSKDKGGDLGFFKKGMMVPEFDAVAFNSDLTNGQVYPELVKTQFGFHIIKKIEERGEGDDKEIRAEHILIKTTDPEQFIAYIKQQFNQPEFVSTGLSGRQLKSSQLTFNQQTSRPEVSLEFNDEGKELFKNITERNVGKPVAIYLDGNIISAPIVQDVIRDGKAVINGKFTVQEAKELAGRLNAGALPVPIKLISQQSVEASLGKDSLNKSIKAGIIGLIMIGAFMVSYYRLAGLVAVIALVFYSTLMVAIFKISSLTPFSITLTLSGIAGFVLSVGMAVDANVLIFERMKEEIGYGRSLRLALEEGFRRAWPSIWDGNISTILTALILMTMSSGFIKGFALILILGILVSMMTAVFVTKLIFEFILRDWLEKYPALVLIGYPSYTKNEKNRRQLIDCPINYKK